MKQIDLMIFDLDGTLVSSGADLVEAINYTLEKLKLPQRTDNEIIGFVGDGIRKLIERSLGGKQANYLEQAVNIFSDYYGRHLLDNTKLYPHVPAVLNNFEKKKKVILTNKRHKFSLAIARGLKIDEYFEEIIGADSTPFQKPDRRLIDYLLNKYSVEKNRTVMIGDGANDIAAAKNSGILSLIHLNGLGNRDELLAWDADYYCESLLEINSVFI